MRNKFLACTIFDHDLYFISEEDCILMKMNIDSGKVEYLNRPNSFDVQISDPLIWKLPDKMIVHERKIYVLETDGKRLVEYYVDENRYRCIELDCSVFECCNFAAFAIYNDKAYIFPSYLDKVIVVDLTIGSVIQQLSICTDILYEFGKTESIPSKLFSCGCRVGNSEWIFMERLGEVVEYNMETDEYQRHIVPAKIKGCAHAEWKNDTFYILSLEGKVYKWNFYNNNVREWSLGNQSKSYPAYREMVITNGVIWILPEVGNDILLIDIEKDYVEKYSNYPVDFSYEAPEHYSKYYVHCEDDNFYYFSMHSGNYIFCVEKFSGKEKWIKPIEPNYIEYYAKNSCYVNERRYNLKNYFSNINLKRFFLQNEKFNIGSRIWERQKKYESL